MRTSKEIMADLKRRMPKASHERHLLELLYELLDLPEGYSFEEVDLRVRRLREAEDRLRDLDK